MKTSKEKIVDIKVNVKKCIGDRKGANSIIDILCHSQDDEPSVALAAVRGLQQVFAHFFAGADMTVTSSTKDKEQDAAHDQLCEWLQQQYHTTCNAVLEKLEASDSRLREGALVALMKFVEMEAKYPLQRRQSAITFPDKLMQDTVDKVLSTTEELEPLIARLSELTEYNDVRYYLMKALKHNLGKTPVKERTEKYLANVLNMIYNLQLPDDDTDLSANLLAAQEGEVSHSQSINAHKKLFTACIMGFLRSDLTANLYRKVLTKLDEKLLPFMSSPLLLADFLTESYNIGGAISLLALNGLFILIHKYNLDYPDFYKKFYSLLQPQVFQAKYCARFFYLADIFLSSTHLPAYLVAAFIKRISRLALTAPPAGAKLCIVFVENLLVRHPSCTVLVHRPDHTCQSDPYLPENEDPSKTCAMESSLWEIKTLQSHYSPEVAQEAMKISHPIKQEQDIANMLDDTTEQMIERAMKKKTPVNVPVATDKPFCLFDKRFKRFFSP